MFLIHEKAIKRFLNICAGVFVLGIVLSMQRCSPGPEDWQPAEGPLQTRWTHQVSPENVLPEYPRPQMVRPDWLNLNGLWELAITTKGAERPVEFHDTILVPFPVESALSGIMTKVQETERIWYRREFEVPDGWHGRRLLLHFGAVDWEAQVYVNGEEVGQHQGGYDA